MSDDDLDFASLMLQSGVAPLREGVAATPRRQGRPTPPARAPRSPTPPPSRPPTEVELLRAQSADAKSDGARAARERDAALASAAASSAELEEARASLDAERTRRRAAQSRASESEERVRAINRRERERESAPTPSDLLAARGLTGAGHDSEALRGLLELHPDETIAALSNGSLARLLAERVQLLCGRETCPPEAGSVVVRVARSACDVCAGSDIRASFDALARAAERAGTRRITIVGGSPAYRKQLRGLCAASRLDVRLELVPGTKHRDSRKVQADLRSSDVVVLWGATLLDHSLADAYRDGPSDCLLLVGERGITRMLAALVRKLDG